MELFKFELGQEVKDSITGFKGVIMVRSQYLTSCNNYGLLSKKLGKDGEPTKWQYFDETLLSIVGKTVAKKPKRESGGPSNDNQRSPQR